jgi:hypothetical protein
MSWIVPAVKLGAKIYGAARDRNRRKKNEFLDNYFNPDSSDYWMNNLGEQEASSSDYGTEDSSDSGSDGDSSSGTGGFSSSPGNFMMDWAQNAMAASGNNANNWNGLMGQAQDLINQPVNDPYAAQIQQWYNTVMAPGYSYYTPEQMDQMYQQQAGKLQEDVFSEWNDAMTGRIANQNTAGSGVAQMDWEALLGKKGGALGDLKSNIFNQNQEATQNAVQQALAGYPAWQGLSQQQQAQQWNRIMDLLSVMSGEKDRKAAKDSANAAGWADLGAALIGAFL